MKKIVTSKYFVLLYILTIFFNSLSLKAQSGWSSNLNGGSISPLPPNPSANITIIGNNGGGGVPKYTYISKSLNPNQKVKFQWTYTTTDYGPYWDPFISQQGGITSTITFDNGPDSRDGRTQTGSSTITITSNGEFRLGIYTLDGTWGASTVIITNLIVEDDVSLNITPPVGTLTSNCAGIPSTPITFGVSGSNLSSTIVTVSAPAGFEIKTVSSTIYAPSVILTPVSNTTVSSTLHIRLLSGAANNVSGTITALSTSGGTTTSATTTVTSTIVSAPTFTGGTTYSLCKDATYLISLTVSNSYNGWSTSSNTITVNNGYVTAGTSTGPYTVSYTDACAQTVSATVTVGNSDNGVSGVSGGQASYKISNSSPIPQGPTANVYVGYNGFNYYSTTKPTNTGFYKANNQSGNNAGCPYPFYIFRCTTCPD